MAVRTVTDEQFMESWDRNHGSPTHVARDLKMSVRNAHYRRREIEGKRGEEVKGAPHPGDAFKPSWAYHRLNTLTFDDGIVIVYSDAHYWPHTPPTLAFRALVRMCAELKPVAIVANGDLIDGAKISRFAPNGWAKLPGMKDEIDEMQARQKEIVRAAPKAKLYRTVGNHDLRYDRHLVQHAESMAGLPGTRLADFLPEWKESYSVCINDTHIKHRFRSGIGAGRNNALQAGVSIVTGHLHVLDAKSLRGYRDARIWGVQTGTLSEEPINLPEEGGGPFEYSEDSPTDWASGFAVLTYYRGRLLAPEFCQIDFGRAWFRGKAVA